MKERTEATLNRIGVRHFRPPKGFSSPFAQTICPHFFPAPAPAKKGRRFFVDLQDEDKLVVTCQTPATWSPGQRIVVLIHGLAGSEDSPYIRRVAEKFFKQGFLTVKVNLRSCGPGRGLARNPYHCGRSEDTKAVIEWVAQRYPESPITQVGFSLSANISIKMLGEEGSSLPGIDSAVCVSPPLDLHGSAQKIIYGTNGLYDKFFIQRMKQSMREMAEDFEDFAFSLPKKSTMKDFDELYTAPLSGFKNADDYYTKTSSKNFVKDIKIKSLILHSLDDPVADSTCLSQLEIPDMVDVVETSHGGHVGFWQIGHFWMDEVIVKWVKHLN